jgi:hypothetical protein
MPSFLPLWIDYLGEKDTDRAFDLLVNALGFAGDPALVHSLAERFGKIQPGLYTMMPDSMENTGDPGKIFSLAQSALSRIPAQYTVRSKVARRAIAAAAKLRKTADVPENLYFEAFVSESTVSNLFRLQMESRNRSTVREEAPAERRHGTRWRWTISSFSFSLQGILMRR